jgi:pimeloyl-ACP methyl ester carboxylesterase
VHGLLDSPAVFNALKRCLGDQRQPLLIPELPLRFGLTPISEAAELLGSHIEAAFGLEQPIDLLGFSIGGVIARTWIQLLGGQRRTRRFTSVGSPQQGTLTAQPWPGRLLQLLRCGPIPSCCELPNRCSYWPRSCCGPDDKPFSADDNHLQRPGLVGPGALVYAAAMERKPAELREPAGDPQLEALATRCLPKLPHGISKASLVGRESIKLERLVLETRRAELVHLALWLPPPGVLIKASSANTSSAKQIGAHTKITVWRLTKNAAAPKAAKGSDVYT